MVCRVRYLSSAGIHRREIPGITALERAYPPQWLLYASLQCFPRGEPPIEMDAMVVMDDRVLILELKDFNGRLTQTGDLWNHNGRRFRSPVQGLSMKARKLKSFLQSGIPGFNHYVDFRVVVTGNAGKAGLTQPDRDYVLTLQEAESIATPTGKRLLMATTLRQKKTFAFEPDFERITQNAMMFGPLEAEWDGHRVVEEDFVVHPDRIWREHRAEQMSDQRYKALLRIWSFDKLPPGLNSPDRRQLIANRERRAIGRLYELGSPLVERSAILTPIGEDKDEILTQHFELRRLISGQTTLDRYLNKSGEDLGIEDRLTMVGALLEILAELHTLDIAHRDLGPRSIWAVSPTRLALGGLMTCELPDEESLGDWSAILRGHTEPLPEDGDRQLSGSGKQRDVYALGRLAFQILTGEALPSDISSALARLPSTVPDVAAWLTRATATDAKTRHPNARAMADDFAGLVERSSASDVNQVLLDQYETPDIPYVIWPVSRTLKGTNVYVSKKDDGSEIVVKTWPSLRRGMTTAGDIAMTRLFDGAGRLISTPLPGLPRYLRAGLSPTGPFVAYRFEPGLPLDESEHRDFEAALKVSTQLLQCVTAIHDMGHSHGDVAPKNILVRQEDNDLRLLDLFDISEVGDGRVRTPALCPEAWESLTTEQLDRFATTKIIREMLVATNDSRAEQALAELDRELGRPRIETLEPVAIVLREALKKLDETKAPTFRIAFSGARGPFVSDGGRYYIRAERTEPSVVEYSVAGTERELTLVLRDRKLVDVRFEVASFPSLAHASQHGVPIELGIELFDGEEAGLDELLTKITPLVEPPLPETEAVGAPAGRQLDVPRYWRKLLDLEAALLPEVEIIREIGPQRGPTAIYTYERINRDFDFDAGSTVDVKLPNRKKLGELDLEQTDGQRLTVNFSDRRLVPGERVNLVDRRSRTSFDRRTKAVERILEDEAAIDGLVDYFQPHLSMDAIDYGEEVPDAALDRYRLNKGQRTAFRHVVRYGPVGLLQGPPGTGKTHFIASIVHWLTTVKGARRILIASQSHEAVNNAIEAMLDLHKELGSNRPSLLRIGSKGITEKIRPYHTASLQQRFQSRFEGAFTHRVAGLASGVGLKRALVADAIEIDRTVGERARRLELLAQAESGPSRSSRTERGRRDITLKAAASAFVAAAERVLGRPADVTRLTAEVDAAYETLLSRHPDISPSDVSMARQIIALSREWSTSLATPYRNFEEFLAKTRTIVTATCVGVGQTKIKVEKNTFDWVIVDEAARCTPGELAVPIQLGRRVLLVGDHRQLLPMTERVVLNGLRSEMPETPRLEFERSDFERAYLSSYGLKNGRTLTEQYRMTPVICDLISKIFYEPHGTKLVTSPDRKADLAFAAELRAPLSTAITWIDTSEERWRKETAAAWDETTYSNRAETDAVMRLLERIAEERQLVDAMSRGNRETPIGIICMYSAQKSQIEEAFSRRPWGAKFRNMVRIDTVDSYQGKENTIVIVSLVRSNDNRDQGHVRIPNRCNVALSRAKERLFIVGDRGMWGRVSKRFPMRMVFDEIVAAGPSMALVKAGTLA
ncbi:AAA family ATPase [Bradyrhizobium sp. KB893862 SZCCT0404]|uniref:AAA domain-containing protein n=1 Tax=Bradyrhizobium sp. KB893862 SZCCT0404 TaxID=2807672 RepID=UPI001BA8EF0C|nr:AAA domain-containing protein [Bradyrhizobium sp. KB893862 SZCCT0404]MBR1177082.1 AAA family ATPase [Bradyrhizobium sp. KB893862 SZCCT0404]